MSNGYATFHINGSNLTVTNFHYTKIGQSIHKFTELFILGVGEAGDHMRDMKLWLGSLFSGFTKYCNKVPHSNRGFVRNSTLSKDHLITEWKELKLKN